MSKRAEQFEKEYPASIIPPGMMAVSISINYKSRTHPLTTEETPIYLALPRMMPALAGQFLRTRLEELSKEFPKGRKKKKKETKENDDTDNTTPAKG